MAILYIFGDESGTMPLNDDDNPFVAAAVAVLDRKSWPVNVKKNIFEVLKGLNALPSAAIVKPFPGYSKLVKTKYDKLQVMAQATRLVTGASSPGDFSVRNTIWSHAMIQAVGQTVLRTIFTGSIEGIQILLDEKTMRSPERSLFTGTVINHMEVGIKEILARIKPLNQDVIVEWENRVLFSAENISINWSDESEEFRSEFGLNLAHRLSQRLYGSVTGRATDVGPILRAAGFDDPMIDITGIISRLDQRIIDNFRRNTGLPEPRESIGDD